MSLIEVMMAVAVLSVAILGVMSAVAFGLRSAAYGQRVTEAVNFARQTSEIIRAQGLAWKSPADDFINCPALTTANFNSEQRFRLNYGAPFAALPADSVFRRQINVSQVGSTDYEAFLYRISVVIFFYERGSLRRVEMTSLARRPR